MLNNIKRNLKILNKDVIETSWLKCLLDDVPKPKHLLILFKCLGGQYSNINAKSAQQKIGARLQHIQKPITALKTFYLVHELKQYLLPYLTINIIDTQPRDQASALLQNIGLLYFTYLKCQSDGYEQINILFRMHRQLEVLIIKLQIPIIKQIAAKLMIDSITLYESLSKTDDFTSRVKAAKQVKRFLELRNHLQLSSELYSKITSIKFAELHQQTENITPVVNNFFELKNPTPHLGCLKLSLSKIQEQKLSISSCINEETIESKLNKSLQTSPMRKRQVTNRAISIRDSFFVPQQGPLSFMIMS